MNTRINIPEPIGYLKHKPTRITFKVYHKIPRFHRYWLKVCFGLVYKDKED